MGDMSGDANAPDEDNESEEPGEGDDESGDDESKDKSETAQWHRGPRIQPPSRGWMRRRAHVP